MIRVDSVATLDPEDSSYLMQIVRDAVTEVPTPPALEASEDPYAPELEAWQSMQEAIVRELAPKLAAMIDQAYRRRLPWRYPPA